MGDSDSRTAYREVLLRGYPERRQAPSNLQSRFYPRSRFCSALLHILRTCSCGFCAGSGSCSILGPAPATFPSKSPKVPRGTLAGDQCRPVLGTLRGALRPRWRPPGTSRAAGEKPPRVSWACACARSRPRGALRTLYNIPGGSPRRWEPCRRRRRAIRHVPPVFL